MMQVRLKAQEKKVDHMERAKRLEEIPLLREQHEDLKAERKQVNFFLWQAATLFIYFPLIMHTYNILFILLAEYHS
jgi:hypothetical protein